MNGKRTKGIKRSGIVFAIVVIAVVAAHFAINFMSRKAKDAESPVVAVRSGDGDTASAVVQGGDSSSSGEILNAELNDSLLRIEYEKKEKECYEAIEKKRKEHFDEQKKDYDALTADFFKNINFEQDLSGLTMGELLYLRNSVYAAKGMYFKEENLNSYFLKDNSNIDWYSGYMCFLLEAAYEKKGNGFVENEKDIKLSDAEKKFVARVDRRIAELRKDGMYITKNGQTVGNAAHIINKHKISGSKAFMEKIAQNNFVIETSDHEQLFHLYQQNDYNRIPSFVTTDLYLQAFHMYLSYTLKKLEREKFISAMKILSRGLFDASIELVESKDAELARMAEYNAAFYAVPYTLLTGNSLEERIPKKYRDGYAAEVRLATEANADGVASKLLAGLAAQGEPMIMNYSLFKPRGNYTRAPELGRYFKAMMWLQKAFACRDREAHLKQSIFTAVLLNTVKPAGSNAFLRNIYASVYEPTALLAGEANNLSVMDIAMFLRYKENIADMAQALSAENVEKVDDHLKSLAERIVIKPKILATCADKINFMPQRYLIDNEILQELTDIAHRPFPKGLDVFAALGSESAADVLNNFYKEDEKWGDYSQKMSAMRQKFKNFNGWDKSTYNKWLQCLLALQKRDKSYPVFMNTAAWDYKNLNTSLASWAELKHDFILYGEQPTALEDGTCYPTLHRLPEPDAEVGYVEPNIWFWNKLGELIALTNSVLVKNNLLDADLKGKTEGLQADINFLIDVSKKELAKKPLSPEEYKVIKTIGGNVEDFTATVVELKDGAYGTDWSLVTGPDRSIAIAADVFTGTTGVLHAAVGNANTIYVVVEINGYLYLTRGATFRYHEFVMPGSARLTDEEWQKMEAGKSRPAIPEWMRGVVINERVGVGGDVHPVNCFERGCECDEWYLP
ncbi:MAG: DUF3160 domain-containing protein [Chitinispirillales bacterium]|jgi:hypothetical protein|nr:DUF3160 domain-containing protein [Chitinispirillales bacterium]